MKIKKSDVGKLCLVRWDDIGREECMLLDCGDDTGYPFVYNFRERDMVTLDDASQIVELGDFVTPNSLVPQ